MVPQRANRCHLRKAVVGVSELTAPQRRELRVLAELDANGAYWAHQFDHAVALLDDGLVEVEGGMIWITDAGRAAVKGAVSDA